MVEVWSAPSSIGGMGLVNRCVTWTCYPIPRSVGPWSPCLATGVAGGSVRVRGPRRRVPEPQVPGVSQALHPGTTPLLAWDEARQMVKANPMAA